QHYAHALAQKPDDYIALTGTGMVLANLGLQMHGSASDSLRQEALAQFHAALRIMPDHHPALYGISACVRSQAFAQPVGEAIDSLKSALEFNQTAIQIKP